MMTDCARPLARIGKLKSCTPITLMQPRHLPRPIHHDGWEMSRPLLVAAPSRPGRVAARVRAAMYQGREPLPCPSRNTPLRALNPAFSLARSFRSLL